MGAATVPAQVRRGRRKDLGVSLPTTSADEYDSPWKEALEQYLPAFFALFFPRAHAEIDWSRPPVFRDKELQQVVRDAALGRRLVDKLVQV
jgi:hypothetical protein